MSRTGLVVHLLACLSLPSILQRLCHVDFRSVVALQQQDEGLETAQAVALGSRHGRHHARQQAVCHVLAVCPQEIRPVFADVGHQLVRLLLSCLVTLLHTPHQI